MARLSFGKKRRKRINYELLKEIAVWGAQIAIVSALAFGCVWYFGHKVSVIGESMKPRLENGDITVVNRLVYDIRKPKRGDVIAFKPNGNENSHYYIKRIIGLPGETVEIREGKIYVDGMILIENYGNEKMPKDYSMDKRFLLEDEYFVLGDNRNHSIDSREYSVGAVKRERIIGKAKVILYPFDNIRVFK